MSRKHMIGPAATSVFKKLLPEFTPRCDGIAHKCVPLGIRFEFRNALQINRSRSDRKQFTDIAGDDRGVSLIHERIKAGSLHELRVVHI